MLVGNVAFSACQWGVLIALARLGAPELVGRYSLGLAIASPVLFLSNLGLRTLQATDSAHGRPFEGYVAARVVTSTLAAIMIIVTVLLSQYQSDTMVVVMILGASKVTESLSDICYGLFLQRECIARIAHSLLWRGVGSLIAVLAALLLTGSVVWAAMAVTIVYVVALLAHDLPLAIRMACPDGHISTPHFRRRVTAHWQSFAWWHAELPSLIRQTLPLGVAAALISLSAAIPRYFLQHAGGERAVGLYSAMAYVLVAGSTVVNAIGQSTMPRLAKLYVTDWRAFDRLLQRLVLLGAVGGIIAVGCAYLWGSTVLRMLYSAEYAAQGGAFVLIVLAASVGFLASFLWYGMSAARCFAQQVPLFAGVVVTVTASSALFIPRWGMAGAGVAATMAALVQLVWSAMIVRRLPRGAVGRAADIEAFRGATASTDSAA